MAFTDLRVLSTCVLVAVSCGAAGGQQPARPKATPTPVAGAESPVTQAQGDNDTPIIIADGSLTMESKGVPWSSYSSPRVNTLVHPHTGKSITLVEIAMPGKNRTVRFSEGKCTVAVRYASTDIVVASSFVTSGNIGVGLQVKTEFPSFYFRDNARYYWAHLDTTSKISHVTVTRGDQIVFDSGASGGTTVTIHFAIVPGL